MNGPRRQTILPLDASAFEGVSAEDGKWLAEQEARFASDSEGLATKPNFALISFEAVNFMDGHRSTAEIADLLSAEYLLDIDQAWVDRLVNILEKQKLVAKKLHPIATCHPESRAEACRTRVGTAPLPRQKVPVRRPG